MGSNASEARSNRVIAIDGPAASGKSSVARELARQLGFIYVNSGGFYRAITWYLIQKNILQEESDCIATVLDAASFICTVQDSESRILVDNTDPAEHLRDDRVNESVSRVSRLPRVRQIVSQKLHDCAGGCDVVIEGRDIGSVVFKDTPYKFYLDASPDVRLHRRIAQGERDEIAMRDRDDVSRALSPLVIAAEAHVIDTSHFTIQQVVDEVIIRLKQLGLALGDAPLTTSRAR
ncbi:MAG TPA: (d)CMP kinase [Candidatus Udaeobacter sp.]|jgi:cytidylate kinase|nr:(d)CMP kinase [Candidatus Udaeobacter sp.]